MDELRVWHAVLEMDDIYGYKDRNLSSVSHPMYHQLILNYKFRRELGIGGGRVDLGPLELDGFASSADDDTLVYYSRGSGGERIPPRRRLLRRRPSPPARCPLHEIDPGVHVLQRRRHARHLRRRIRHCGGVDRSAFEAWIKPVADVRAGRS